MTQQFGSNRDMLQQIAYARMTRDETDVDMSKAMLSSIAGDTVSSLSNANEKLHESLAVTLTRLAELGYDKDSDVAKSLVANSMAMAATMTKIGDASARIVNR